MKRISNIQIENYRAYYDRLEFKLEKGENLLLYGENGSGKTSLYKALDSFFQSFYSSVIYAPNRYKPTGALGEVVLGIGDYNPATELVENVRELKLADGVDNTNIVDTLDLKALALSKGFLNYRDLLRVYLFDEKNHNLFEFFIKHLLRNHVPVAQGMTVSLLQEWDELNKDIFEVYNRNERKHKRGLRRLGDFEVVFRAVLTNLFTETNKYLSHYFDGFGLEIEYDLKPMQFDYGRWRGKCNWSIKEELYLKIKLRNDVISDYTDGLNEARLSAISVCLYLAALRANPGRDLRVMFLDDIFIGIDSSNRWPILEILDKEFTDFQIIIASYDRSWYCMARNHLTKHRSEKWKFVNLFSLPKKVKGQDVYVPVLTSGKSAYDKAKEYLHGQREVDLPAAANYFRKALEELISEKHLPKELFLSEDFSLIPGFKLTKHVGALVALFLKIGEDATNIMTIEAYLHPLIHPLSHFEEEIQVYRSELMVVENAIAGLIVQIEDFQKRCKLLMGRGNKVEIQYCTADGSYRTKYQIFFEENMWVYKDATGNGHITEAACHCVHMEGVENGKPLKPISPNEKMKIYKDFCYKSLDEALLKIYDFEVNKLHHAVIAHNDYNIVYKMCNRAVLEPFIQKRDEILATI